MTTTRQCLCALAALTLAAARGSAQISAWPPPPQSPLVVMRSDIWVNLHHFLYQQARATRGFPDASYPAAVGAQSDTVGLGSLSDRERADWNAALAYYKKEFAARAIDFDSTIVETNYALAHAGNRPLAPDTGLSPQLVSILTAAGRVYRQHWWPSHDASNRAWAQQLDSLLHRYGDTLVASLQRVYRVPWPRRPVPLEVATYANWAGAYTTLFPTLITMSSRYRGHRGTLGLEQFVHEVSHAMTDSLDAAFRSAGVDPESDEGRNMEHSIIFFSAGELVREDVPTHTPYAEWRGLWTSGPLARFHAALLSDWLPYLRGATEMRAAVDAYVRDSKP